MAFDLNPKQKEAVEALNGRVLIRAGAGSGKTRTLAERFVGALEDHAEEPWAAAEVDQVLTITYTDKAAVELTERIRATLRAADRQDDARRVDGGWISTIHGFCSRTLRRYALEAGIDPAFAVADTVEAGRLVEQGFEAAARESMATPEGEQLFGAYTFDVLFGITQAIASALTTHGLTPDSIDLEPTPDARQLFDRALALFSEAESAIRACDSVLDTVGKQLADCEGIVAALRAFDPDGMSNSELGFRVWAAIESWKARRQCNDSREAIARVAAEHPELVVEAALCAVEPFANALRALVSSYVRLYADAKRARGLLDFNDLQSEARDLILRREDVREACAGRFRLVMVDEFQDTDQLQLELVEAVAGDNLCTVGDERQSIYRFRGADLEVYREHFRSMQAAGARHIELAENYRSHGEVLGFANAIFDSEMLFDGGLLKLEHKRREAVPPFVPDDVARVRLTTVQAAKPGSGGVTPRMAEAMDVARQFAELRDGYGVRPSDMVVLIRTYSPAEEYAQALRDQGFQALVLGGARFFDVDEVVCLRSLLRAVANPADDRALAEVLASPLAGLSDDSLWILRNTAGWLAKSQSMWEALAVLGEQVSADEARRAARAIELLENARRRAGRVPLSELLLRAVEESDFDLMLLAAGDDGHQGYANVLKLARMADEFEASGGAGSAEFEAYLLAKEEYRDRIAPATLADDDTPAVRILSVHSSKGLEFPVVAVPELNGSGRSDTEPVRWRVSGGRLQLATALPSSAGTGKKTNRTALFATLDDIAKAADAEEEKRLFYVACTRAREVLILTGKSPGKSCDAATASTAMPWLLQAISDTATQETETGVMIGDVRVEIKKIDLEEWEPPVIERPAEESAPPVETAAERTESVPEAESPIQPPASLSYSDLGLFKQCNKRFWAEKILRLGKLRLDQPGDAITFGSAVHAVLELVGPEGALPDEARIAALFSYYELSDESIERLHAALDAWVSADIARELVGHDSVRREMPFAVPLGEDDQQFLLIGNIDAYGKTGVGGLIVDYKTGLSGGGEELRQRFELQARCYALVALRDGCDNVKVSFVRPEVVGDDGQPEHVDYEFGSADAALIEQDIIAMRAQMRAEIFEPLESWAQFTCSECPIAGGICPVKAPKGVG